MPLIRLLPCNPDYLESKGNRTVLVAATEHHGAVLNCDSYVMRTETFGHAGGGRQRT